MAWGCMFATSIRKICFLYESINAAIYQDVLNHFLLPYIEDKFGYNKLIFEHDG